jgi:hypothetical protein
MNNTNKTTEPTLAGVIGYFGAPDTLIKATRQVRDARYQYFDVFTPYPIHGMDAAQGLKRSPLPFVTFIAGLTGGSLGFLIQYWTSAVDWPLNVGGKPFNSWPAFIPITFELTVLFAGLATVGAMFLFNGLPNLRRKSFDPGLTNDKFALVIEAPLLVDEDDAYAVRKAAQFKKFDEAEAADFLRKLGAQDVRTVYTEGWFGT